MQNFYVLEDRLPLSAFLQTGRSEKDHTYGVPCSRDDLVHAEEVVALVCLQTPLKASLPACGVLFRRMSVRRPCGWNRERDEGAAPFSGR